MRWKGCCHNECCRLLCVPILDEIHTEGAFFSYFMFWLWWGPLWSFLWKTFKRFIQSRFPNECCLNLNLSSEDLINFVEMHLENIQVILSVKNPLCVLLASTKVFQVKTSLLKCIISFWIHILCFLLISFHFLFFVLVNEVMKIPNYYPNFCLSCKAKQARKNEQTEHIVKKNMQLKWPK